MQVETINFVRGDERAAVVTCGIKTRVYGDGWTLDAPDVDAAIRYLAARSWCVLTDQFETYVINQ